MLTITTDSALGIRCRSTIRDFFAPITVAAWTKSRSAECQHLAADQARGYQPCEQTDDQSHVDDGCVVLGREHEHDQEVWDRQQDVDEAHHRSVGEPGQQTRDRTPQGSDHGREHGRQEADLERRLAAQHDPSELVEAVVVGPQDVRAARRLVGGQRVADGLVGVVDERPHEAEQQEEQEHRPGNEREAVVGELAQRQSPAAGDDVDLTALRGGCYLIEPRRREVIESLDRSPLVKGVS